MRTHPRATRAALPSPAAARPALPSPAAARPALSSPAAGPARLLPTAARATRAARLLPVAVLAAALAAGACDDDNAAAPPAPLAGASGAPSAGTGGTGGGTAGAGGGTAGAGGGTAGAAGAPTTVTPAAPPAGFAHAFAEVDGVRLHYVIGGQGPALVLLHGWPQTWYEWNRLLPDLAGEYTVIAPDLRGAGESDKVPLPGGYDKHTLARDVHGIVQGLGHASAFVVGHDIGGMVAYAYAVDYPAETRALGVFDVPLPGVEPFWSQVNSLAWHFGFHNEPELPEQLVAGREREYLTHFYDVFSMTPGVFRADEIDEFVRAYSAPGAMRGGFDWYRAFGADAAANAASQATKLTMPVLGLHGDRGGTVGNFSVEQMQQVAVDVRGGGIVGSGHWLAEEKPEELSQRLRAFLAEVSAAPPAP
ncbi:MAG TPA: alpha/beta hydrolase [Polyangiaceae bacterium]|nr:alpha/beta hydrolase [Polyangiaceae bacterium]